MKLKQKVNTRVGSVATKAVNRSGPRVAKAVRGGAKVARKTAHHTKRVYRKAHYHVAKRPHEYALGKWAWYAKWHQWRWHKLVHVGTLAAYTAVISVMLFSALTRPASALSAWNQTNWSGGSGTSTSNQYSAASNVDATTANQLSLSKTSNSFTNSTFDSDISNWNGLRNSYDTTQSYSASGSAKITPGTTSNQYLNTAVQYNAAQVFPQVVASGDINNDGRQDVAVGHYLNNGTSPNVSYYLSKADGTLDTPINLSADLSLVIMDIKVADLNGDGYGDIVVSYWSATKISVFINNGSGGGFASVVNYTVISGAAGIRNCGITIGNLNSDNYPDIVVICYTWSNAYVLLNNGNGTFPSPSTVALTNAVPNPTIAMDVAIGDINGDGKMDIAVPGGANCNFDFLINDGSGNFSKTNVTVNTCGTSGELFYSLSLTDIDNDGKADVVIPRYTGTGGTGDGKSYITIYKGTSSGVGTQTDTFSTTGYNFGTANRITSADINADGYNDIAFGLPSNYTKVLINNGDSTFTAQNDISGTPVYCLTFGDTDGDNRPDLIVGYRTNSTTNTVIVYPNRAADTLTQQVNVGDTSTYHLEAYVYTTGAAVTSADSALFVNGSAISTTYASTSTPGWYKLSGTFTGANARRAYGVLAKQAKTQYVDNLTIYKYSSSGTLTSAIFDPGYGGDWGSLTYATTIGGATTVKVRTSNDSAMTGATSFSSCTAISSGADISSNNCVTDGQRYIQYQVGLTPSAGDSPVFTSFQLQYGAYDIVAPTTNASSIQMSKVYGGNSVSSGDWTNGGSPYFSWTAGADNAGGSGLMGYCLYLGQSSTADPQTTKGILGTSPVSTSACPFVVSGTNVNFATAGLLGSALTTSNSNYYLIVKAVDVVGNIYTGSPASYTFKFDNTAPSNPAFLSAPSQYVSSKAVTLTWPTSGSDAAADNNSGVAGLQYQIGTSGWYGDSHSGSGGSDDLLSDDGSYTTTSPSAPDEDNLVDGVNIVYIRTWDQAGNVTTTYTSAAVKINTSSAPSAPQGVGATPTTNTENSFSFNWSAPATFSGDANNLTYCYTINTLPSSSNCTYTAAGVTSLSSSSFATQPDENTFYVVAKDEAGNINYSNHASTSFYANTPAPGIPVNVDIADVSIKATSNWRLAVTWDQPSFTGAGITRYRVYRSTDGVNFSEIGTSSETSYVNTGLNQITYYYKVKACDSANQCSALSSVASDLPTGKFTSPATLVTDPTVSNITTKRATINWSTDRGSDSKITIGTTSGTYSASEVGNSNQTTTHEIELDNLAAGTTYYYKAKWTDEDGNTGQSQEFIFTTAPAPVLKEVDTISVGLSNAVVRFTTKDSVKSKINFGKSDSFGGEKAINTSSSESTYEVALDGLDDGTKYFYRITMFDSEGGAYNSSIFSFTTPPRPRISNLRFQPVSGEPTSTQQVTWTTNVATNSIVDFGIVGAASTTTQTQELKTEHEITIRGLQDDSEYYLLAQGRDANGNLAVSDKQTFKTALDTRPPEVSEVVIEPTIRGSGTEARGQIVVSWKTDEPATSQVAFGEGSNVTVFNNKTAEDGQLTTEHLVIVSDLPPSKVYSIAPISKDKAGNEVKGQSQAAIIGRASDGVLNIVLNTLKKVFGI